MTLPRWHIGGYKETKDPAAIDLQLGDSATWISVWGPDKEAEAKRLMAILNAAEERVEQGLNAALGSDWLS